MRASSPAVPLFFAAALGALAGIVADVPAWPLAALAAVASAASLFSSTRLARAGALVALAFTLGAAAGAWQRLASAARTASLPNEVAVYEGIIDDISFGQSGARRLHRDVSGALIGGAPAALPVTIDVHVPASDRAPLLPGDRIRVRGIARPLAPALSPGELDAQRLGLARGTDGGMVAGHSDVAVVARAARLAPFAHLRLWLRDRMAALLPPRMAGLELALLVGDISLLDDEQREIYRKAGAGHLLAVSGLQVSLLALLARKGALAVILLTSWGRRGRGRTLASALALAVVWCFVLLCGVPPSAVRAAAMATAILAAPLFGRRMRSLDALGTAGLLTVLVSPASVLDPSFLLSYAAVLGLAATTVTAPLDRTPWSRLRSLVVASVGAGVVTLPLSAYLFGTLAPAGLVANIILVPAATILQVPALALGLVGALLSCEPIAWLGAETALVLEALTAGLGDLLPGVRAVDAPSGALTLFLLACALAFAGALARRTLGAVVCAAVALCAIVVERHEPDGVRITVLPVGQGDSAVFEFPDGAVMIIDGGGTWDGRVDPGVDVVLPFLARRGITHIDLMVLSHPHPDHALGLVSVARAIPPTTLWHNGADAGLTHMLERAAAGARVQTTPAILGTHDFHGATLEVMAPAPVEKTSLYPELEANDNSLVLRICYGADCALWPGDAELLGEDLLLHGHPDLHAAVVKAPHHGSKTSSTDAFVKATGARDVILCTGIDNHFGFPSPSVVDRWHASGARTWDTAQNGELRIVLTGHGVSLAPFHKTQH